MRLYLDIGSVYCKGVAIATGAQPLYMRYPSVVAHQLVEGGADRADLFVSEESSVLRLPDFDAEKYPRSRSYPEGQGFRRALPAVTGARYVGWQAVAHGADRALFGDGASVDMVDALVHKALLLSTETSGDVELVLVIDPGAGSEHISQYAQESPRSEELSVWKAGDASPTRIALQIRCRSADASDCALHSIPASARAGERLVVLDVGFLRSKLYLMSQAGCERFEELRGLGVADCVRRVLRDGQEEGLVEDEFAVMRALEQSRDSIEIAGRRFDVGQAVASAERGLVEELTRAAEKSLLEHFKNTGHACKSAAIIGGGSALVGGSLAQSLEGSSLGLDSIWVTDDPTCHLVEGARRLGKAA